MQHTNEELRVSHKWHHENAVLAPLWVLCAWALRLEPSTHGVDEAQRWRNVRAAMTPEQRNFVHEVSERAHVNTPYSGWSSTEVIYREWRFNNYIFCRTKRIKY